MVVYRISHEDIVREPTLKVNWLVCNWASPNQTTNGNISGAGDTIFFPWSKMRGNNGRYGGSTGSANIYWIASPKYTAQDYENYGYVFSFSYSGIVHATAHGSWPSAGYNQAVSVRPVRETD